MITRNDLVGNGEKLFSTGNEKSKLDPSVAIISSCMRFRERRFIGRMVAEQTIPFPPASEQNPDRFIDVFTPRTEIYRGERFASSFRTRTEERK